MTSDRRRALALALTIAASNLASPLAGLADTATAARLQDPAALAAVGLGSTAVGALLFLLGFLRMGITGPTARDAGRGDAVGVAAHLLRGLLVALGLGAAIVATLPLWVWATQRLLAPEAAVAQPLAQYLWLRLPGAPAFLAAQVLYGWFLGQAEARTPLRLVLTGAALNALLDPLLALGLGLGVGGIGLATSLADAAVLLLGLGLARRRGIGFARAWSRVRQDPQAWAELLRVNRDLLLRNLALQTSLVAFAAAVARLGTVALAAQAVLVQLFSLTSHLLDGFAFAAEALVGRALGVGDRGALQRAIRHAFEHGLVLAALLALGLVVARPIWIPLLASDDLTARELHRLVPLASLVAPLGAAAFLLDGIYAGAVRTAALRRAMLLAAGLFLTALASLGPALGHLGLWGLFLMFLTTRGLALGWPLLRYGVAVLEPSPSSAARAAPIRNRHSISSGP